MITKMQIMSLRILFLNILTLLLIDILLPLLQKYKEYEYLFQLSKVSTK